MADSIIVFDGIDPDDPLSFLLLEGKNGYTDTDAIVRVLRSFGRMPTADVADRFLH